MNVTTTPRDTSSSTLRPRRKQAKRAIVGSAVLVAGGVTAVVVNHNHGPSTAPGLSPAIQQAKLVRADRLLAELDGPPASGDDVMAQIHALTGASTAAQQARSFLYQQLRNR